MTKHYDNLGPGSAVPGVVLNAVPDMQKVKPSDWSVLAQVDGSRTLDDILDLVKMPRPQAVESLQRLKKFGMITVGGEPRLSSSGSGGAKVRSKLGGGGVRVASGVVAAVPRPKPKEKKKKGKIRVEPPTNWPIDLDQFIFDPLDLAQEVAIEMEKRKQIIYYHYHLKRVNYYDLFQVERTGDGKSIRKAYFKLSKEFHPDLFFRKELGSYRVKVEEIFKWLSQAYATLSHIKKRASYDGLLDRGLLGEWQIKGGATHSTNTPTTRKSNPSAATRSPADVGGSGPRRARGTPSSPSSNPSAGGRRVRVAVERGTGSGASGGGGGWVARGERAESRGEWQQAVEYYVKALDLEFAAKPARRAARCLLKLEAHLDQAEALCRSVLEEEEQGVKERVDTLITLARVLERLERSEEAYQVYLEAQGLDPANPVVRIDMERMVSRTS